MVRRMSSLSRWLCILLFCGWTAASQAEVAVIVHADSSISLTPAQVINVYLGLDRSLTPIDLRQWTETRAHFYQTLVRKNEAQLKSYWATLIFTGKGRPPRGVAGQAAMVDTIAADPLAIGYVDTELLDDRVRVLFIVQ